MTPPQHHLPITPTNIKNIHESPDNPRIIPPRAIDIVAASIDRFGWQQPIVTTTNGEIIAGHTRYRAAKQLGHTTVPVHVADNLTDEEVRAYRIADNRSGDFASWDIPRLVDELDQLDGSFNDELALEDWDQIMADYEDALDEYNNPDRGRFAALQQEVESTSRLWAEDNAQRIRKKMEKRAGVHREEV